jgi:tetratricopeptide (TPR) repeat protein
MIHRKKRSPYALAALLLLISLMWEAAAGQSVDSRARYNDARRSFRSKEYKKAIADLEKAVMKDPTYIDAWWLLGLSYRMDGQPAKAGECYKKVIKLNRKFVEAYLELAEICWQEGKIEEAEGYLKESIKQNSSSPYGHYGLGVLYYRRGKIPEAMQSWETSLRKDKLFAPGYYCIGIAKYNSMEINEAIRYLNRADELEKRRNQLYHFSLGWAYRRAGKAQFAKECFDESRGLGVDKPIGRTVDALRLIEGGKHREAKPILEKALEEDPQSEAARYLLGKCFEASEEWEKAQETYRMILKDDPLNLDSLEAMKEIEKRLQNQP